MLLCLVLIAGIGYYLKVESKEEYLVRMEEYDNRNEVIYRIEPMPNVFVAEKFVLGNWDALRPMSQKKEKTKSLEIER